MLNTWYRPHLIELIPVYIRRKNGLEKPEIINPLLGPLLHNTFGLIVYQEQIMKIAEEVGGFRMREADELRRAMSKKDIGKLKLFRKQFFSRSVKNGMTDTGAVELFNRMVKYGEYGFPRYHSVARTLLAFQTGFLKANYPVEYMTSALFWHKNNLEQTKVLKEECRRMGIKNLSSTLRLNF